MSKKSDAALLNGPMSTCDCGHTGDLRLGATGSAQHAGLMAHGACEVVGCKCVKFTWAEFLPGVAEARKRAASARTP